MIKYTYISILLLVFLLSGCEKSPQALKPSGKIEKQIRGIGGTGKLFLTDDIDLVFSDSVPSDEVWVIGGKYLLDWITVETTNDSLIIGNENTANWLRSYEKRPLVKVPAHRFYYLEYDAAGHVSCESVIQRDSMSVVVSGGGGSIHMEVSLNKMSVANNWGTVDMHFTGYSHLTYLFGGAYGPVMCQDLYSHLIFMTNNGYSDVHARGGERFVGRIHGSGNVYIYGDPEETDVASSGSGRFITVQ